MVKESHAHLRVTDIQIEGCVDIISTCTWPLQGSKIHDSRGEDKGVLRGVVGLLQDCVLLLLPVSLSLSLKVVVDCDIHQLTGELEPTACHCRDNRVQASPLVGLIIVGFLVTLLVARDDYTDFRPRRVGATQLTLQVHVLAKHLDENLGSLVVQTQKGNIECAVAALIDSVDGLSKLAIETHLQVHHQALLCHLVIRFELLTGLMRLQVGDSVRNHSLEPSCELLQKVRMIVDYQIMKHTCRACSVNILGIYISLLLQQAEHCN